MRFGFWCTIDVIMELKTEVGGATKQHMHTPAQVANLACWTCRSWGGEGLGVHPVYTWQVHGSADFDVVSLAANGTKGVSCPRRCASVAP